VETKQFNKSSKYREGRLHVAESEASTAELPMGHEKKKFLCVLMLNAQARASRPASSEIIITMELASRPLQFL
jgi:hypothetical protein